MPNLNATQLNPTCDFSYLDNFEEKFEEEFSNEKNSNLNNIIKNIDDLRKYLDEFFNRNDIKFIHKISIEKHNFPLTIETIKKLIIEVNNEILESNYKNQYINIFYHYIDILRVDLSLENILNQIIEINKNKIDKAYSLYLKKFIIEMNIDEKEDIDKIESLNEIKIEEIFDTNLELSKDNINFIKGIFHYELDKRICKNYNFRDIVVKTSCNFIEEKSINNIKNESIIGDYIRSINKEVQERYRINIKPSQFLNLVNKSNKRSNEENVYGPISKRLRSANYQIADNLTLRENKI